MSHGFPSQRFKSNQWHEDAIFADIIMFLVLAMFKSNLLHSAKIPPKQLIRRKFFKDELPKSNQI